MRTLSELQACDRSGEQVYRQGYDVKIVVACGSLDIISNKYFYVTCAWCHPRIKEMATPAVVDRTPLPFVVGEMYKRKRLLGHGDLDLVPPEGQLKLHDVDVPFVEVANQTRIPNAFEWLVTGSIGGLDLDADLIAA